MVRFLNLAALACLLTVFSLAKAQPFIPVVNFLLESDGECSGKRSLGDEFECDSLEGDDSPWSFINGDSVAASFDQGNLQLELTQRRLWFNADQGVFMHKLVSGDFKATARLSVFKTSNPSQLPDQAVQLAGLMIRDPSSDAGPENYVFIVAGFDVNDISVESKQTINSVSEFVGPTWPGGEAELRLCRVGTDIYLYKRLPGESVWQLADDLSNSFAMPRVMNGLGDEAQVGLNIYTSINNFDVSASFEFLRIEPVASVSDCTTD